MKNSTKSQKWISGLGRTQKTEPRLLFATRRVQNLHQYQTEIGRALRQIFLPTQIFGVLPLRLVENKVQICFVILPFSVVGQFVISAVIFLKAGRLFVAGVSRSNATTTPIFKDGAGALNYAEEAGKTIVVLYVIISTITFCQYRHKFASIIRRLITVKILMSQFGLNCQLRSNWLPVLLQVAIALAAIVEFCIKAETISSVIELFIEYSSEIMAGTVIVFFVQLLYIVESMLAFLNDQLLKMMSTTDTNTSKYVKMSAMSDCHHYLCSVCYFMNTLHSFPLLLLYLSIFVKLVVLIFKILIVLANSSPTGILTFGAVLATYIARSWCVVYICSRISDQTKLFNKNAFEMILFEPTEESTIYIKKLLLHLEMKREFKFDAKGFFTVDYPLLHSVSHIDIQIYQIGNKTRL